MPDRRTIQRRLWREGLQHEILIESQVDVVREILDAWRVDLAAPLAMNLGGDDPVDVIEDLIAQVPMLQARIKELEAELDSYRPGQRDQPRSVPPPAEVWDGRDPEPPEE